MGGDGTVLTTNKNGEDATKNQYGVDLTGIDLKVTVRDKEQDISQAQDYTGDYTWSVNLSNGTVTVNFGKNFFLERDRVYSISFNVKLTEKAYEEYGENGYGATKGDAGTDYADNSTSSEKPGLQANNKATVTYSRVTQGKWEEEEKEYPKPVVQVPQDAKLIIKKQITNYSQFNQEDSGNPLAGDDFFINIESADGKFHTTAVLGHEETAVILADGKTTYTISEILPKEYTFAGFEVSKTDINGKTTPGNMEANNQITINPGEAITVTVKNTFENKSYFHNDDSKDNTFHGSDKSKQAQMDMKKEEPQEDLFDIMSNPEEG